MNLRTQSDTLLARACALAAFIAEHGDDKLADFRLADMDAEPLRLTRMARDHVEARRILTAIAPGSEPQPRFAGDVHGLEIALNGILLTIYFLPETPEAKPEP